MAISSAMKSSEKSEIRAYINARSALNIPSATQNWK